VNRKTDQATFVSAFAVGTDARELVNICVRDLGDLNTAVNFGFVYASDALANQLPRLMSLLADATSVQDWCGTLAPGICYNNLEVYDQPAVAILLCQFNDNAWQTFACHPEKPELAELEADFTPGFGIIHADPNNPDTPAMIERAQSLATNALLTGGLTRSQTQPLQIAGNRIYDGVSGVYFDNSVAVLNDITQTCAPIGVYHEITAAQDNQILSLDNQSALGVLCREAGEFLSKDLNRLREYVFAGISTENNDRNQDRYLLRDLLTFNENENTVTISTNISVGDKLIFCSRDGNNASQDLDEMLERVRDKKNGAKPLGAIYHNSVNRGKHLFGSNSLELKRIQASLGDVPLIGYFTAGEIYRGQTHTHSGVLTVFV